MIDFVRQKQLVEEHYAAFWSDAPDETLAAQVTSDFVDHAMPPGTPPGPGPVLAWRKAMRTAFPDMQVTAPNAGPSSTWLPYCDSCRVDGHAAASQLPSRAASTRPAC